MEHDEIILKAKQLVCLLYVDNSTCYITGSRECSSEYLNT